MTNLQFWTSSILDGIASGFIYGLFALAVVIMYRTNKIFNFAQASIVSFMLIVSTLYFREWPLPILFVSLLLGSFLMGTLLHFSVMRLITEHKGATIQTQVVATFGLMTIFDGLSSYVYSDLPSPFPSIFPNGSVIFGGFSFSNNSIGIICVTLVLLWIVALFFKYTRAGLLMEAVAENVTASRLRGIRASNILMLSWGVAGLLAMVAGLLIAPITFVSPDMLFPVFGYSLFAVIIGGLESPFGAIVGGVLVGVVENVGSNLDWIGSELKYCSVVALLMTVLIIRPRGLFGRTDMRRV